jgi:peptide/nickel transport system substrate-binding protein
MYIHLPLNIKLNRNNKDYLNNLDSKKAGQNNSIRRTIMKKAILSYFILILVIASLLAISCSPKTTTTSSSTTTSKTTTTSVSTTATPIRGGTITVVTGSQPAGNQVGVPWKYNASVPPFLTPVVEPLITSDPSGKLLPWLAKSWKIADDYLSITFTLRNDVKFHDGTPLNAAAAKWNIDQQIAAKAATTGNMKSVETIDEFTFKINLTAWDDTLLNQMTNCIQQLAFISPTTYQANGDTWAQSHPIGTGPFTLVSWDSTVGAKMVRNPNYWQTGKPYLDEIDFKFLTDPTAAIMTLQSGQADMANIFRGAYVDQKAALAAAGYPMVYYKNGSGIYAMFPDSANATSPLANGTLRQAIEYATDKEALCKSVGYGLWTPTWQACPPANAAYNPNLQTQRKYDLAKAKQLIAQSGYNGTDVINIYTLTTDSALSQAIQSMWKAAGINAQIVIMDQPSWVAKMGAGWTNGYLISAIGTNPIWLSTLPRYFASPAISYVSMARSASLNQAFADARASKDLPTLLSTTQNMIKVINDDAMMLPLFMHEADYNVSNKIQNPGFDVSGIWNTADIWKK